MTIIRLILFVSAISINTAFAAVSTQQDGHLVIIGGGLRDDNAEIGNRIVALAGGKGAKIAIIPAAAADPQIAANAIVAFLNKCQKKLPKFSD